jgi:hypothetical protein
VKINVIGINIVKYVVILGTGHHNDIQCDAVLVDRHGNQASAKYTCWLRFSLEGQAEIKVDILGKPIVLQPYNTEFIQKVSIVDNDDKELAFLEAEFVMHQGDTVTLTPSIEEPDIVEKEVEETLTGSPIKDIDDLPGIDEWPEYFPGKWMED